MLTVMRLLQCGKIAWQIIMTLKRYIKKIFENFYHLFSQPKYRICCHRKIAACAGVFGKKVQTDALHNCFINDQGLKDTNVEGDLKVEHMNLRFKAGLMQLCGNYSEDALQRTAKSLDVSNCLLEKLTPYYTERYLKLL